MRGTKPIGLCWICTTTGSTAMRWPLMGPIRRRSRRRNRSTVLWCAIASSRPTGRAPISPRPTTTIRSPILRTLSMMVCRRGRARSGRALRASRARSSSTAARCCRACRSTTSSRTSRTWPMPCICPERRPASIPAATIPGMAPSSTTAGSTTTSASAPAAASGATPWART